MILKFASSPDDSTWTFVDNITKVSVNNNPSIDTREDTNRVILCFRKDEEVLPVRLGKDSLAYLLNDDGKTIECLN